MFNQLNLQHQENSDHLLTPEQKLKAELIGLVSKLEHNSRRAFTDAKSETNEMGKRLIEHGAMCMFNCALSIKEVLKHYEQLTSQPPLKDQF